jgi:tripartite-type tricarboxylate transporter receptor subunit TctC
MTPTRRLALGLMAGAALFATGAAHAQTFPSRVVKVVVPYPAGGPTDAIARIVAEELGKSLGQNAIVENVAGASGAVGTRQVARRIRTATPSCSATTRPRNNMFLMKEPGYDAV